jgi:cellulose synthase (UDP-forming)
MNWNDLHNVTGEVSGSESDAPLGERKPVDGSAAEPESSSAKAATSAQSPEEKEGPEAQAGALRQIKLGITRVTIVVALFFTARYLYWRVTETMNPAARWFFYAFLVAEVLNILESLLFYVTTWAPTRYRSLPPLEGRSVDVMIATYNEPVELLRETVLCAVGIRYPHQTLVLDDGDRPEVRKLAEEFNCIYMSRRYREHAKAGNLNNGLLHSKAEFVVTLDADHVPSPELIDQLIGFFRDDSVGAVQTAQDFYNLDSFQHRMNWRARAGWQQQELFFNVIQPGKDRFNAAFYCGSPAMLRRSALDSVGGFATETITEDMHTGVRLQKKQQKVLYYNQTLAFGLAPQTFLGFATQWQRWGYGCMQVMRSENPIFGRGMGFGQRLCYFASMYFYWMSYQKLLFVVTPIIALLSGIFPLITTPERFSLFFFPFFAFNVVASVLLQGGFRSYFRSEQFNILKMHVLLSSVKGLFVKKIGFKVTPKSRADAASLTDMLLPVVLCVLLAAAMVVGGFRLAHTTDSFFFWALVVNICWAAFYLFTLAAVVASAFRRRERRRSYRFPARLELPVVVRVKYPASGEVTIPGYARNLNRSGMSFTASSGVDLGTAVDLEIQFPTQSIHAAGEVVRHTEYMAKGGRRIANGVRFTKIAVQDQDEISRYLFWRIAPQENAALQLTHMSQRES